MSKTVDEKVVEMRFDNQQFERNVQTSMTTINNLKKSLNMEGAAKGFENIGNAAKNCNVSALGGAVEAVRVKFSALEVMAVTALANITNSAVNAGKRITSALTLDPIRTGFQEYETQINAVQTILANTSSKGTTLDQVNNALDELNHYADMTIYNFTEMTRNIGTFTAAGIDLDTSVSAIKGIANLAAVSGSNSTQASTAMYQLSQALAAGTVKLQDWNSVVNAGMGGQVFQDALKDTARVHGIAIDQMIKDEGSFRETLQKGWLTSEVLTETLAKFTGDLNADQLRTMGYTEQQIQSIIKMGQTANDAATKVKTFTQLFDTLKEAAQSGWTKSWEIIIGDFEEAKELLTSVSDTFSEMINASAESRNKMLQDWKDLGGRTMLIESVRNVFEGLLSVIRPIKEAFRDIFPAMTGQRLAEITEKIRDLTAKFKIGEETSKNLKNTFKGLFAVFDIVAQAVKAIFKASGSLFDVFSNLGGGVLKLTGHFGNWLVKLDQVIKQSNIFNHVLQGIVSVIEFVVKSIADLLHLLNEKVVFPGFQAFHSFLGKIHEKMSDVVGGANDMETGVVDAVEGMNQAVSENKILQFFQSLWEGIKTVTSKIIGAFGKIWSVIHEKFQNIDFGAVTNAITSLSIGSVALAIDKLLGKIGKTFDGLKGVLKSTTKILDGVRGCLEAYQTRLKAGTLLRIATSIAILSASIVAISLIDTDRLFISLGAITTLFGDLIGAMAVFNKISKYSKGVIRSSVLMLSMSSSISILASALKKIGDLDWKQLSTGMGGIVALTAIMVASAKVLGKDEKTVIKGVWEIHAFVIAIQLLAGIVKDLGALDWESLAKGLVGVAGLSATIAATAKIMSNGQKAIIKGATKMIIFAAAIKVLASACKDLSKLSWTELAKGLTGVGVLLAEVSIFMNNAKLSRKSIATATGIVILSSAIKILASACKDFGQLSVKEIIKGLSSIGVLLAEISVFTKLSGDAKHVISTGISLIAISSAMKILASAVGDFGSLSLKEIGKGLTTMAVALAEVVAAMRLMPKSVMLTGTGLIAVGIALETISIAVGSFGKLSVKELSKGLVALGVALAELSVGLNLMKGTLSGSAAMLVAASAIAILTPSLFVLSAISWQGIAKSLILLAGAFTVIGTAGLLLQPLVPTLIGLSGAFALIGVGAVAIGAGMLAAGVGLTSLATGLEALAGVQTARVKAFVDSLKIIITGVAEMIPVIIGKIGEGFVEFCKAIEAGAPDIMSTVKTLILGLIDIMVECVPNLVDGVFKMVTEILKSLVEYTPQIVDSIFHFLIGILEGIAKNLPTLIKAAADVLMAFLTGIFDAFAGMDTDVLLKGLAGIGILSGIMVALGAVATLVPGAMVGVLGMGAVVAELAAVLAAIGGLQQIPGLSWLIGEGGKLLGSIGNAIGSFVGGIVGGVMEGISSSFPQIGANLSAFMINIQPFIEGASQIDASSLDGVKALAEIILMLTAADILDGLTAWFTGGSSLTQFAEELVPFGTAMKQFAVEIAGLDGKLVSEAAIAGRTLAEMAATLPNSGGVLGFFAGENDLDTFSEKVVPFGRAMKAFAAEVAGLDPAVVTNAATAGKALAEMAATLPNSGGVVGFFAGENDLDTFGEKLAPFGRALKEFALEVEGLDPNAVVNAATAGQAMAEMAKTLPNSGGVVGFFAGENDLDTFGEKLVPFGKALKEFAIEVRGLVVEDVEKAATAGQMMAELEKNIDNTGGVVGFFVGNNDLDTFGEKLPPFGRALKEFALAVQGLVVEDVEHAANAGRMLAELEQALPKDGGIVSWFAGNKDLAGFGDKLRMFGQGLADFYTCIIIINPDALARVIAEINKLVDLAKGMETLDTGKMSGFSKALTDLGKSGVEGFISAFTDATSRVKDAAANVLTTFINSAKSKQTDLTNTFTSLVDAVLTILKNKYNDFTNAGKEYMVKFIAGVKSQVSDCQTTFTKLISDILTSIRNRNQEFTTVGQECMTKLIAGIRGQENNAKQVFTNLVTACLTAVKNKYPEFESSGKECIIKLITGVKSKEEELKQSFVLIISAALNSIRNSYDEFYSAGNYLVEGFAEGINKNTYKAEAKARAMAKAAAKAAKKELDEHSPSKVFYQIGAFAAQGLVNALSDYEPIAGDAGTSVAHSAMEGLRKTIAKMCDLAISDIDIQPTIRPVLDLSDVRSESKKLNAMFSREQAMSISRSMNRREMESTIQNEGNTSPQNGNIYQFTQNNYSPKPLSRLEIYRQTRNQFSAMREAVERV